MKTRLIIASLLSLVSILCSAQTNPAITRWLQNTTTFGRHYVSGNSTPIQDAVLANCQTVRYSASWVYVNTNGIPTYITGPYLDGNPSTATSQNAIFKIPLAPTQNTGTPTATNGGNIGIFINGVAFFDYRDGSSWKCATSTIAGGPYGGTGDGVWNRDAVVGERSGFDCSKGHPAMGNYHHHQNPSAFNHDINVISTVCNLYLSDGLYSIDSTQHSPLLGFAYDGFPIYGAYGYKNTDGTGGLTRMKSSYQLRNISTRTTYADGTSVSCGPAVSATYPLGYFREDYQYIAHPSDPDYLDEHNGRFCVTPEYPNGIYAYFATVDANWNSAYPYLIGPTFYGNKTALKVTSITETVTTYPVNTTPYIYIAANSKTICPGTTVTFTAATYNAGLSPSYQWKKNGTNVGINSNTYSNSSLANNDIITCVLTTASSASATSNSITMSVSAGTTPSVTISASPSDVCTTSSVLFSSNISNGGTTPLFLWKKNGTSTGVTSSTYQANSLVQGDVITCQLTSNAACVATATVTSSGITMTCNQPVILNLTAFIQGYYTGNQQMNAALYNCGLSNNSDACDSVTIELHGNSSPYTAIESQKALLNKFGNATFSFSSSRAANSYYIALRHRNSIETWSAAPVQFFQTTNYNFTTAQSKAYGSNQVHTTDNLYWAIYSGDISASGGPDNQDQVIEAQDYLDLENAVNMILTGYSPADITGDGIVEATDYMFMENNVNGIIFTMRP
jgi:hypothetical protein